MPQAGPRFDGPVSEEFADLDELLVQLRTLRAVLDNRTLNKLGKLSRAERGAALERLASMLTETADRADHAARTATAADAELPTQRRPLTVTKHELSGRDGAAEVAPERSETVTSCHHS